MSIIFSLSLSLHTHTHTHTHTHWHLAHTLYKHKYTHTHICSHAHTAENKKVTIRFIEGGTVHSLPWSELLTIEETPFESVEAVMECVNVLAPWWYELRITPGTQT